MRTYIVKTGDSLGKIANRLLGSSSKWPLIATANNISDPNRIRVGQRLHIPDTQPVPVPEVINPSPILTADEGETVTFSEEGGSVYATLRSTGEKVFVGRKKRNGLYRHGGFQVEEFVAADPPQFSDLHLSPSEARVIVPVSDNEGDLDAINTWDNSFLSFGIFQWTAGRKEEPGELAALLAIIKQYYPDDFHNYWGQYGLDVSETGAVTGWLTLNGRRLRSPVQKDRLRDPMWAFRFMRAGADADVQAVQMLHAVNRLDRFYFRPQEKLGRQALSQLITSEYGVALLLDNHVNRPGYLVDCVALAFDSSGLRPAQLVNGSRQMEQRLLNAYLSVRETYGRYPMTHAAKRAETVQGYVQKGAVSNGRGSFRSHREQRR